jgi:hypothetical protein
LNLVARSAQEPVICAGTAAFSDTDSALPEELPVLAQEARSATLATPKEKVASVVFIVYRIPFILL